MNRCAIRAPGILVILAVFVIAIPIPLPVKIANKRAFHDPAEISYSGEGTLYACTARGDLSPAGKNVVVVPAPMETATGKERTLFVYTPPGFDPRRVYPALYCLHGYAARPGFWVENLLPAIESAIIKGGLPPVVILMPDGTIGGNGRDNPATDIDERGGAWYINSNLVKYENFLLYDLPAFIDDFVHISSDPGKTVIVGSSMGGFGAALYSLKYPEKFRNAALFYPALDLNYAVRGKRLAPYEAERYRPVRKDKPVRIVNKAAGAGVIGLTDKWCFYPVFDSDKIPGSVWSEDIPVWERMESVNPKDILEEWSPDLRETRYFILTGGKDDFNFDDHQDIVLPLLKEAGAVIDPATTIVPEGRHAWSSVEPYLPSFIEWLDNSLK